MTRKLIIGLLFITLFSGCADVWIGLKEANEASGLGGRKARPGEVPCPGDR